MKKLMFSITKKDFTITWFSGTGAGGQNRNKCQCCCRLKHNDSGVVTTGQNERSRESNLAFALSSMGKNPKFLAYCNQKIREMNNKETLEEIVDRLLLPENLKIESQNNGKWEEETC